MNKTLQDKIKSLLHEVHDYNIKTSCVYCGADDYEDSIREIKVMVEKSVFNEETDKWDRVKVEHGLGVYACCGCRRLPGELFDNYEVMELEEEVKNLKKENKALQDKLKSIEKMFK